MAQGNVRHSHSNHDHQPPTEHAVAVSRPFKTFTNTVQIFANRYRFWPCGA